MMAVFNGYTDGSEIRSEALAPEIQELVNASAQVRELAYCKYSSFQVGAALLAEDGQVFTGCNVENSSSGATICAEQTAAVKAISQGVRKFKAIAVVARSGRWDKRDYTAPCGICRQFLVEFGDITVFLVKEDLSSVRVYALKTLLPESFLL